MKTLKRLINRTLTCTFVFFTLISTSHGHQNIAKDQTAIEKILMVVTSNGLEQGKKRPGYEFDEFAQAYLIFKDNGFAIDVASPAGGEAIADKYNPDKAFNQRVLSDQVIMAQLKNTLATSQLKARDYAAVFVVGGKGTMFDLPDDKHLQRLIRDVYQDDGTIGAVCHGPAALVNVKLGDGSYLVAGKAINSFTNIEESVFGKKWAKDFDFMLETRLKERGALFEHSEVMMSHVAINQRIITGQNPASTPAVAEALIRALGHTPNQRTPFEDETTLVLIAKLIAKNPQAEQAYQQAPDDYNSQLVAMYGYYRILYAQTSEELEQAIYIMELAGEHFKHPKLSEQIALGYEKLAKQG